MLAIRYDSSRFTRDLDFSTTEQYRADMADQSLDECVREGMKMDGLGRKIP